jgi:endonuclease YncB( thermonuclease family)
MDTMRKILLFLMVGLGFWGLPPALLSSPAAAGQFYVIDGDTFFLNGRTYRLWGIDAPEKEQACRRDSHGYQCGIESRSYLRSLIEDPTKISCERRPRAKKETRIVALCRANGEDLAQLMVSAGWAINYAFFSKGYYAAAEKDARVAKRGLWAGEFQAPQAWRRQNPR